MWCSWNSFQLSSNIREWFESGSNTPSLKMIIWMIGVLRRTVLATDVSTTREDGFRTSCRQQLSFSEPQSARWSFSIKVSRNMLRWIELAYNCTVVDSGERSRGPGPSSYFWTKVKPVLNSLSPKNTKNYESAESFFFLAENGPPSYLSVWIHHCCTR